MTEEECDTFTCECDKCKKIIDATEIYDIQMSKLTNGDEYEVMFVCEDCFKNEIKQKIISLIRGEKE